VAYFALKRRSAQRKRDSAQPQVAQRKGDSAEPQVKQINELDTLSRGLISD